MLSDVMDCTCDSVVGNSFIANVNLLASQFGTLQKILDVPGEVDAKKEQIKLIESTIESIHNSVLDLRNDTTRNVQKAETLMVNTGKVKEETVGIHAKTLDVLDRCREYLRDIKLEVSNFEADMVLAEGVSNGESVINCPEDLCPGFVLTIKGFRYPVGRNTLLVSNDGVELYRWIHFEEVGPKGSVSSMVKFNVPVSKGSILRFYNISSSMAEAAFVKAKELKCEIDGIYKKLHADVQTVVKCKDLVEAGVSQVNVMKHQIKDYVDRYIGKCNGVIIIPDRCDIPEQNCVFLINELMPRIPCSPCNPWDPCPGNKTCGGKPLFADGTICGTIAKQKNNCGTYKSGCFDINYNNG